MYRPRELRGRPTKGTGRLSEKSSPSLGLSWVLAGKVIYVWAPGHTSLSHCIVGNLVFQKAE